MKLEELNKILKEIEDNQNNIFKKAVELFENNVFDLQAYKDIGAYKDIFFSSSGFLIKEYVDSENIESNSIEYLIETLKDFNEQFEDLKEIEKIIYSHSDVGDGYISFIGYQYSYYKISEDKKDSEIMRLSRERIREELKPYDVEKSVVPDCKIVKLFRDGVIDWDTLQKITYQNCKL